MKNPMKKLFAVAMVMGAAAGVAGADAPRTLANGRPACGNTMGKNGPQTECAWQRVLDEARTNIAAAEHQQRLVENLMAMRGTTQRMGASCEPSGAATLTATQRHVERQRAEFARISADYARWKASQPNILASR